MKTWPRQQMRRWILFMILLGASLAPAGCQQQPREGMIHEASTAYAQGDYAAAYETAQTVARQARPPLRDEGALIAGMAAQQLGQTQEAERLLLQAAGSRDVGVAGEALASVGLLYAAQSRHDEAAQALLRAADLLEGESRANAYYYAGVSQQKMGWFAQARTNLQLARATSRDRDFIQQVDEQLAISGYTIQLGAFQQPTNARRLAEEVAPQALDQRIGTPKIVPSRDRQGRQLTLVQVGQFGSFASAAQARDRLGASQAIIVPLTQAGR